MSADRQWIRAALEHRQPPAVPYNFSFSPPARARLETHYGVLDVEEALRLPIRTSGPASIKPLYAMPSQFGPTVSDEFGVAWTTSELDRGSPVAESGDTIQVIDKLSGIW